MKAPAPRPARALTSQHAQQWVLVSAILTALIYAFRRTIEPTIGTGRKPPSSLERFTVGYSVLYLTLGVVAIAAPELAASLAGLALLGNLLTNGLAIAGDLNTKLGQPTPAVRNAANIANAPGNELPATTTAAKKAP